MAHIPSVAPSIAHLPAVIVPPRPPVIADTLNVEISDGIVLAGSDPHWTVSQPTSTATKAFVHLTARFAEEGTLRAAILAGDLPDFGQISRHAPLGWEKHGSLAEELEIVNERLGEIKAVAGLGRNCCASGAIIVPDTMLGWRLPLPSSPACAASPWTSSSIPTGSHVWSARSTPAPSV
jgi:hypothetical protein